MTQRFFAMVCICLAISGVGSVAHAQNQDNPYAGGTRVAPKRGQLSQSGPAAARNILLQFGQCLYARRVGSAERFMTLPVDTDEYAKLQRTLFDTMGDSCIEGDGTLSFSDGLLRGALFEAAYRKKFGGGDAPLSFDSSLTTSTATSYKPPYSDAARRQIVLQDLAECVVKTEPTEVRAMVLSVPESQREETAFANLSAKFGPCLTTGQKASFSKPSLRAILAEALYRVSVAAMSAPKTN
jgi:hypothetical protein